MGHGKIRRGTIDQQTPCWTQQCLKIWTRCLPGGGCSSNNTMQHLGNAARSLWKDTKWIKLSLLLLFFFFFKDLPAFNVYVNHKCQRSEWRYGAINSCTFLILWIQLYALKDLFLYPDLVSAAPGGVFLFCLFFFYILIVFWKDKLLVTMLKQVKVSLCGSATSDRMGACGPAVVMRLLMHGDCPTRLGWAWNVRRCSDVHYYIECL